MGTRPRLPNTLAPALTPNPNLNPNPNPNPDPNPNQVDSDGKLFASFKQQLSPLTLLTLASEVETVNLNEGKHKFGMALSLTP